jgi:hypothetical protein
LPSDRNVRNFYDLCRTDIQAIENKKRTKQQELNELNGVSGSEAPRSDQYDEGNITDGSSDKKKWREESTQIDSTHSHLQTQPTQPVTSRQQANAIRPNMFSIRSRPSTANSMSSNI